MSLPLTQWRQTLEQVADLSCHSSNYNLKRKVFPDFIGGLIGTTCFFKATPHTVFIINNSHVGKLERDRDVDHSSNLPVSVFQLYLCSFSPQVRHLSAPGTLQVKRYVPGWRSYTWRSVWGSLPHSLPRAELQNGTGTTLLWAVSLRQTGQGYLLVKDKMKKTKT